MQTSDNNLEVSVIRDVIQKFERVRNRTNMKVEPFYLYALSYSRRVRHLNKEILRECQCIEAILELNALQQTRSH
jgi:hypothetical protein